MHDEIERLRAYLAALDSAGQAVDRARRLYPDPDLDHAVDRLRAILLEGAERLRLLQDRRELAPSLHSNVER